MRFAKSAVTGRGRPLGDRDFNAEQFRQAYTNAIALLSHRHRGRPTQVELARSIGIARSTLYRYRVEYLGQSSARTITGPLLSSKS